jgi:hypothetical protein
MTIDWTSVIALGGALLTLFASILAFLPLVVNRTARLTAPLDPKIKAIKIKRDALKDTDWKRRCFRIRYSYVYFIAYILVEITLTVVYFLFPSIFHIQLINFVRFIILILIIIYFIFIIVFPLSPAYYLRYPSELRFNEEDAKFYIFQKAKIFVKGDIDHIYSKAQEALRGKKGYPIDGDFYARELETCLKGSFLLFYYVGKAPAKITVDIDLINENDKLYELTINYKTINYKKKAKSTKGITLRELRDIDASSAFINQFIGNLLTQEKESHNEENNSN